MKAMKSMNPFSRDSIERLSSAKKEPSWMTAMRLDAWRAYERFSTDRPNVSLDRIQAFAEPPQSSVPSHEWPSDLKYVVEERGMKKD